MPLNGFRRIVVVDDNHDSTDSLAMLLELTGHEVIRSYDGDDAIEKACACQPDVMLLDLAMPKVDGCQVARRIRQHDGCKDTLLVAITGYTDDAHRVQAKQAGFDHYLIKPVEFADLSALLEGRKSNNRP